MRAVEVGTRAAYEAPFPGGPTAEILIGAGAGDAPFGLAHVELPGGGSMPEHAHGSSAALVLMRSGSVTMSAAGQELVLRPGMAAALEVGEHVALRNVSASEPASLFAVFVPAGFTESIAAWPQARDAVNA